MGRLLFSVSLVVFGIGIGYFIQVLTKKGVFTLPIDDTRKKLQKAALLFFNPVAILGATWMADIHHIKIVALPFMGFTALFLGGCIAYAASRMQHMNRKQTGAYIVCGGFTNIGSLGGYSVSYFSENKDLHWFPFTSYLRRCFTMLSGFLLLKLTVRTLPRRPHFFGG